MITQETSAIAKLKVDKKVHHKIIVDTLNKVNHSISALGISQRCSLSYHAVNRRLKELRDLEKIKITGKIKDSDGATRAAYTIV